MDKTNPLEHKAIGELQKVDRGKFEYAMTLATINFRLQIGANIYPICRGILDSGSSLNLITNQYVKANAIPTVESYKGIFGIGGDVDITRKVRAFILPWFKSEFSIPVELCVLNELKGNYPPSDLGITKSETAPFLLADEGFNTPSPIDALLNIEIYEKIISGIIYRHKDGGLIQATSLGHIVLGKLKIRKENIRSESVFNLCEYDKANDYDNVDRLLRNFWEIEKINEKAIIKQTPEQKAVEKLFLKTHYRQPDGRYVVTLPIKPGCIGLGDSRNKALRQFHQLERRLSINSDLKEKYIKCMRENIDLGFMSPAGEVADPKWAYWIPHHAVLKKLRIVLNASCKTTSGESLNSIQMVGEKLQRDLHIQIMRFRRHKIGVITDISKMFNQVRINPKQYDLQRAFWRESPEHRLKEYYFTVVIFGSASSAHCAVRAMIQGARDQAKHYPEAARVIEECFYIDDGTFGGKTEEETGLLCREVEFVLAQAGFELKHWASNSKRVEALLNAEGENTTVIGKDDETKVLGLRWLKESDELTIFVKPMQLIESPTKREILRGVATLYDPNGFVAPIVINAKMIMQDVWRVKELGWDHKAPKDIAQNWNKFQKDLPLLENFRIPRWVKTDTAKCIQIHGFCDASAKAYGIAIYARVVDGSGSVSSILLMAKSRVAPIKELTIPRMELMAADMLSKQIESLIEACEFQKATVYLWSDAMIVLHWIRRAPHTLKAFVGSRVESIQEKTRKFIWRHVKSTDNPADLVSRGIQVKDFLNNQLWCEGPNWLKRPQIEWPETKLSVTQEIDEEMAKEAKKKAKQAVLLLVSADSKTMLYERFSNWNKIINVTAYILRFINNARRGKANRKATRYLEYEERENAIKFWIKFEQCKVFKSEITRLKDGEPLPHKSVISALNPSLSEEGILIVGGRIDKANRGFTERHPYIIPENSRLAILIIDHAHKNTLHGGIQSMMAFIRRSYWIHRLRMAAKQCVDKCVICVRQAGKVAQQIMAELPPVRVRPAAPFQSVGIDMAGPYIVRPSSKVKLSTRSKATIPEIKGWIIVFICLVTRAVHFEAVESMSADDFLAAYQRFTNRRGDPEFVCSDNGTNFVGANWKLEEAFKTWANDLIQHYANTRGTKWSFIRPCAPHEGGIWEAAVKSMKHHLKRIMGTQKYSIQGIETLLTSVEACMNSRPLCAQSDDPNDIEALTPAHFLIGRPLRLPLQDKAKAPPKSARAYFKAMQFQIQKFWQLWSEDYLHTLMQRPKWKQAQANIQIGQLVLIKNENLPPTYWAMGRVSETSIGEDNKVRSVRLRTQTGFLNRSVHKLCVLPVDVETSHWKPNG